MKVIDNWSAAEDQRKEEADTPHDSQGNRSDCRLREK